MESPYHPNNMNLRFIFSILLLSVLLFYLYFLYDNILSMLRLTNGRITVYNYHYELLTINEAFFFIFYSAVVLISFIGLFGRKKWAYYLFHIVNIPVLVVLFLFCRALYIDRVPFPWIYFVPLLLSLSLTVLVNVKRAAIFLNFQYLKLTDIGVVVLGIIVVVGLYIMIGLSKH